MKVSFDAVCDIGLVRGNNEDMVAIPGNLLRNERFAMEFEMGTSDKVFCAVADGMGGHKGGEVASEMVLSELNDFVTGLPANHSDEALNTLFDKWIQAVHERVSQKGAQDKHLEHMGTTLVGLLLYEKKVFYFNAGDSRLYRFRRGLLKKLTQDHSLQELGGMPDAPSNILMNSIGAGDKVFVDFADITDKTHSGDIFLLCSDGLTDLVSDETVEHLLDQEGTAEALVNAAKDQGARDNISVVLAQVTL